MSTSPSLTREQAQTRNNRYAHPYRWRGETVWVCDSARTALLIDEMASDAELDGGQKWELLARMMYAEPERAERSGGQLFWEMTAQLAWEAFGLDADGSHASEAQEPVFDWREDAGRIRATMRAVYGIDWDAACGAMGYREACDLLAGALEAGDNPFRAAVHYRTAKPPRRTKHNGEAVDAWEAARRHYALKGPARPAASDAAAQDRAMADLMASALRAAKGARRGQ